MFSVREKPSGVLTFTTNGVPHYLIEEQFGKALEKAYKRGLKDAASAIPSITIGNRSTSDD